MQNLVLRPATPQDEPSVRVLVQSVLDEYGLGFDPTEIDADLEDLEAHYRKRGGRFDVLVNADAKIVGCVGLFPLVQGVCELRKMYLLPEVRGLGWGKKMLEFSLQQARLLGFQRLTLETDSVLKEATQLYTRYGFQPYLSNHLCCRCDTALELWL